MQEAFVRVFGRLSQYRSDGPLDAWVRRIGVNTCLDHYRAEVQGWRETRLQTAQELTTDDADALTQLAGEELLAAIGRLPTIISRDENRRRACIKTRTGDGGAVPGTVPGPQKVLLVCVRAVSG